MFYTGLRSKLEGSRTGELGLGRFNVNDLYVSLPI